MLTVIVSVKGKMKTKAIERKPNKIGLIVNHALLIKENEFQQYSIPIIDKKAPKN